MAFEDSPQGRTRSLGMGFREMGGGVLPVRRDTATYDITGAPSTPMSVVAAGPAERDPAVTYAERTPPPNLDLVFQDPADGEPGRDRMMVHGLWEVFLALALAVMGFLLAQAQPGALGGANLRQLVLATTTLGLLAAASAVALRAGAPNLSVGGLALVSALYLSDHAASGWFGAALTALGICLVAGLAQGLIVVGLHVPSWAVSLAIALGLAAWLGRPEAGALGSGYDPSPHAYYWFTGFVLLSVGASLLGGVTTIRRGFGRFRPIADPARRRGTVAGLITIGATIGSSVIAGIGGLLAASTYADASPGVSPLLTSVALGAALLGGTSVFGRRGGIFGTVFAAGLISVGVAYAEATDRIWPMALIATVTILVGLGVTRLVERFGRPAVATVTHDDDDWAPRVHALTPSARWQQAPTPAGGLWASDDPWRPNR